MVMLPNCAQCDIQGNDKEDNDSALGDNDVAKLL